ncbi:MAG TPA: hypothetical protein VFH58_15525 [Acidimicrobiales bacterium]|nr:hypothetical protein [Acidimicrobiales bacterium]
MAPESRPALLPAPTVGEWRERLAEAGTVELMPFTRTELASVGAGSPVRGLVADEDLAALDGAELQLALERARRSLAERGYAGPAFTPSADPSHVRIPLGGDLAGIVAVRRAPALVATVSAGSPELVRRPGGDPSACTVLAILHGVAAAGFGEGAGAGEDRPGLLALLEETTAGRGLHFFALSTPTAQAARILEAWHQLEEDGATAVSVHVFIPDPRTPRHIQVVLQPGVARMSDDGVSWQRSCPDYEWSDLFQAAVAI